MEIMVFVFIGMALVFLAESCEGGGGSASQLLYLLLYVPVHLFVWCYGSFHLKLEFQAPLYELSTKTSAIWKLFFKRTANWLRLLHRGITVFILYDSVVCCQLFNSGNSAA